MGVSRVLVLFFFLGGEFFSKKTLAFKEGRPKMGDDLDDFPSDSTARCAFGMGVLAFSLAGLLVAKAKTNLRFAWLFGVMFHTFGLD